jgi:hypothetical protein
MPSLLLVLTSAGVATILSGFLTFLGQHLERTSRRNELVLSKALDLAVTRSERLIKLADADPERAVTVTLYDDAVLAETYYQWFQHLLARGELPPSAAPARPPTTPPMAAG